MDDDMTIEEGAQADAAAEQQPAPADCAKCPEYLAGWQRAQADYANLKKDTEQFKSEFARYAAARTLETLLPVFDSFEMASRGAPADETAVSADPKRAAQWAAGIGHIRTQLANVLKELGVEPIGSEGEPFDPTRHEAVGAESKEGTPPGTIVRLVDTGWKLNGRILKPARVIVAE